MVDDPRVKDALSNPMYGATPPPTGEASVEPNPQDPGPSSAGIPPKETINPLFGATPDSEMIAGPGTTGSGTTAPIEARTLPPSQMRTISTPPSIPRRPTTAPIPTDSSSLPHYIRRLTYVLSITLGISVTIAGIWSIFLLPLLHASYSARRVLVEQQSSRMKGLVEQIRAIRRLSLYGAIDHSGGEIDKGDSNPSKEREKDVPGKEKEAQTQVDTGGIKQITFEELSSAASTTSEPPHQNPSPGQSNPPPLLPDTISLKIMLKLLAAARQNTATTRTSLISTCESYTSSLHRALWAPKPGHAGYGGVGLNSLSYNLAKEGAAGKSGRGEEYKPDEVGIISRSDDWDAVRREIRGIKGILLNRRNFTPTST